MNKDLFKGELVRLCSAEIDEKAEMGSQSSRDSEFQRLSMSDISWPISKKKVKDWLEKELDKEPEDTFLFDIRTLAGDRLIGGVGLDGVKWAHGDTFVGIGIEDREFWSHGYGTDAMRIILRYAFQELNLHRVSLDVFEYNERAIRSYLKCGFNIEGRARQMLNRDGQRWDLIFMGILREEWDARYKEQ